MNWSGKERGARLPKGEGDELQSQWQWYKVAACLLEHVFGDTAVILICVQLKLQQNCQFIRNSVFAHFLQIVGQMEKFFKPILKYCTKNQNEQS